MGRRESAFISSPINIKDEYKGKYRYEVFLNLKDPFVFDAKNKNLSLEYDIDIFSRDLKKGAIIKNPRNVKQYELGIRNYYIVFEPNQIKLADGTNTTFDGSNPDIRYKKGGRTIAQTPAPKSDRIYGSKVNPKGSAASEKSASKIVLSKSIIDTLQNKLSEFKEKHPNKQNITLSDLKAVYRRGAGAYSSSHRPTISGGKPNTRNAWAMARVNKFLLKAGGTKVKAAYIQDDDLM